MISRMGLESRGMEGTMLLKSLQNLWVCVKYPVSNPGQVLYALGIREEPKLQFSEFLKQVVTRTPRSMYRWMQRDEAEKLFSNAHKKEVFHQTTLASYYFCQGWLEFTLEFDQSDNLRRLYVQHPRLNCHHSIELELLEVPDERGSESHSSISTLQRPVTERLLDKLALAKRS